MMPEGGTEGGADGSMDGTMDGTGGDGGTVPLLSCVVSPSTITKLGDLGGDAGLYFEALLMVPFDDGSHASIIALTSGQQNGHTLNIWTLDTSQNGMPNLTTPQPIFLQSGATWIGRLTGSVGVLACEQIGNNWGVTLYRLKQSDLNQNGMVNTSDTIRAEPGNNPTLTNCHDAALLELSPDHYFTVINVSDQNQSTAAMLGAALNTAAPKSSFAMVPMQAHLFDSIFNVNGTIHAIGVTGMAFPNVTPHDYTFDSVTTASQGTKDLQNEALVTGKPLGGKFAALYIDLGNTLNVRIGTVPDLDPMSALNLPITGLTTGELPLNNGSVRWTSAPAPQLLAAGPTQSNTGINFLWYDADGAAHARQTKTSTLLPMVNNIQAADVASVTPPSSSFGAFPLTWAVQDPQTKVTSIFYGRISCTQ